MDSKTQRTYNKAVRQLFLFDNGSALDIPEALSRVTWRAEYFHTVPINTETAQGLLKNPKTPKTILEEIWNKRKNFDYDSIYFGFKDFLDLVIASSRMPRHIVREATRLRANH